jgi:hypothetical protein
MTRRRGKPNDLRGIVHDRTSHDLLRNAQVAATEIDDPYDGGRIVVMRSVRRDPLAVMLAREDIDQCDYVAGRHWQAAWENAEIGGVRAIDPGKEAVSGGRLPEVLTDCQRRAVQDLKAARETLGAAGDELIRDVLGRHLSIQQAAALRGISGEDRRYTGQRFRECLSSLAKRFGYSNKGGEENAAEVARIEAQQQAVRHVHPALRSAIWRAKLDNQREPT